MQLILASSSIYRRELLARLQLPFEVVVPDIDETPLLNEAPQDTALRLAQNKARKVVTMLQTPASTAAYLVIASDQVATLDNVQIGKPGTHEKALQQLMLMRGRMVTFHTALCLFDARAQKMAVEDVQTQVSFRHLPEAQLDAYLRIEQPYDCAGSAKNEGLGIALIEKITSPDPTALTGLPLIALTSMLRNAGCVFFETAKTKTSMVK